MKSFLASIQQTIKSLKPLPPEASTPGVGLTIEAQKALIYGGAEFSTEKIKSSLREAFAQGVQPFRYETFNKPWYSSPTNRAGSPPDRWNLLPIPRAVYGRVGEYFEAKLDASIGEAKRRLEIPAHMMAQSSEQQEQAIRDLIIGKGVFLSLEEETQRATRTMNPEQATELILRRCCEDLHRRILDLSTEDIAATPLPKIFWPSDIAKKLSGLGLHHHEVGSNEAREILLNNGDFGSRLRDLIDSLSPKVESIKPSSHSNKSSLSI